VQERPSRPVDLTHNGFVEPHNPTPIILRVGWIDVEWASPTAAETYHFAAVIDCTIYNRFDARIQSRDIATTSKDANCLRTRHVFLLLPTRHAKRSAGARHRKMTTVTNSLAV
jgi:hypothetical protein